MTVLGYTRRRKTKQKQHNICWTPLFANKHKAKQKTQQQKKNKITPQNPPETKTKQSKRKTKPNKKEKRKNICGKPNLEL